MISLDLFEDVGKYMKLIYIFQYIERSLQIFIVNLYTLNTYQSSRQKEFIITCGAFETRRCERVRAFVLFWSVSTLVNVKCVKSFHLVLCLPPGTWSQTAFFLPSSSVHWASVYTSAWLQKAGWSEKKTAILARIGPTHTFTISLLRHHSCFFIYFLSSFWSEVRFLISPIAHFSCLKTLNLHYRRFLTVSL